MKKFSSELMAKAHKFTKMMMKWYVGLDYRTEFGIVLKELLDGNELYLLKEITAHTRINTKDWIKGNMHRIYFSGWEGKYNYGYGYWDVNKKEYSLYNKYTIQDNLYELKF